MQKTAIENGVYPIDDTLRQYFDEPVFNHIHWHREIDRAAQVIVSRLIPTSLFVVNARPGVDLTIAVPTITNDSQSPVVWQFFQLAQEVVQFVSDGVIHFSRLPAGAIVFDCWRPDPESDYRLHLGIMPDQDTIDTWKREESIKDEIVRQDFQWADYEDGRGYLDCVMCGRNPGTIADRDGKKYCGSCWQVWTS